MGRAIISDNRPNKPEQSNHAQREDSMPSNPCGFTENDLRRAVGAAVKESLIVFGYEVKRDGAILVLTQPPDHPLGNAVEPAPSPGSVA